MAYKRYIDAVGLAEVIENLNIRVAGKPARWNDAKYYVLREISQAPDADVEEVRHGEWIEVNHTGNSKSVRKIKYSTKKCSVCGYCNGRRKTKRCPNCGAKMDGRK